jgi:hypothetical protein
VYAAALERVHQLNWIGAGTVNRTHPSLYERLQQAGVRPNYPRPRPASRGALALLMVLALVVALFLVFVVNPALTAWLEALTIETRAK